MSERHAEECTTRALDTLLGASARHALGSVDGDDELGRPKERLIEQVANVRDRTLRSAALHRRITILADRGERAEAWRLFAEAQRLEPDSPMLATLELTMLLGQEDYAGLRERGQFWMARLAHDHAAPRRSRCVGAACARHILAAGVAQGALDVCDQYPDDAM